MDENLKWTREYCGLQHLARPNVSMLDFTWVTVQRFYDDSAYLKVYYPGCGFKPSTHGFMSVEEAKKVGEKVMDRTMFHGTFTEDMIEKEQGDKQMGKYVVAMITDTGLDLAIVEANDSDGALGKVFSDRINEGTGVTFHDFVVGEIKP